MKIKLTIKVHGKVQGIMFRQTFIRGALSRKLYAGATNNRLRSDEVCCSLEGEKEVIEKFVDELTSGKRLNSWGASVKDFEKCDYVDYQTHEVTTENVDKFKWSDGVEFYI